MARKSGQGKEEEEPRARQQKEKTPVRDEEKTPACDGRGHHVVEQGLSPLLSWIPSYLGTYRYTAPDCRRFWALVVRRFPVRATTCRVRLGQQGRHDSELFQLQFIQDLEQSSDPGKPLPALK
ncbi:hypothetical protein STEG23_029027 [Scotinomys teguina]